MNAGRGVGLGGVLILLCLGGTSAQAVIREGTLRIERFSSVAPGNPLPHFLFQEGDVEGGSSEVRVWPVSPSLSPLRPILNLACSPRSFR